MRRGWMAPALAGAAAFWFVNLVISATPVAAAYRHALSIDYVPMLAEAAVGGLVLGGALSSLLDLHPSKVPVSGLLHKALRSPPPSAWSRMPKPAAVAAGAQRRP